jgi:hypothetical protein
VKWKSTQVAFAHAEGAAPDGAVRFDLPVFTDLAGLPATAWRHEPGPVPRLLSYRQRPTFRLAYRNFKNYESLVTSQSVEATQGRRRRTLVRDQAGK